MKKKSAKKTARKPAKKGTKKSVGKVAKKGAKKPAPKKKVSAPKKAVAKAPSEKIRAGMSAPAFNLPADDGKTVALESFRGKHVVLYFYPKDMTPGCTVEACDFRDNFNRLRSMNVQVLGVSKDSVAMHAKFKTKEGLNFPLLADVDGKVCKAYGVWKEKSLYGRKYMGIERMTFLIDPQGKVTRVWPKVKVAGHVDEIMGSVSGR